MLLLYLISLGDFPSSLFFTHMDGLQSPIWLMCYPFGCDVQVTIRELNNIGPVLDAAIEAGANNIYGVNFSIADTDAARAQAREEALNQATTQAQNLAQ